MGKINVSKSFFLIFLFLFLNIFLFGFSIKNNSNIFFDNKDINNFIFLRKNECFSFAKDQNRFFLQKEKIIIRNNNFMGFFEKNRFKIFYIVKSKDTLYSIAKKSGHNYHELSKFNFIKKPYKIIVGQKIWVGDILINLNTHDFCILKFKKKYKKEYNSCELIFKTSLEISNFFRKNLQSNIELSKICFFYNKELKEKNNSLKIKPSVFSNNWNWPVKSTHIQYFYKSQLEGNKQIEISGFRGQPIFTAAAGKVVYITDLFKKYGRLIIIRHKQNYLSIYAFNDLILIKKNEQVHEKQQIATMGLLPDTNLAQLYFEIRYKGESINPLDILPKIKA